MTNAIYNLARARLSGRNELGMSTAEYAVGTVSACGFAAVLLKLLTGDFGQSFLKTIITHASDYVSFL